MRGPDAVAVARKERPLHHLARDRMSQALSFSALQGLFVKTRGDLKRQIHRRVGCAETASDLTQDLYLKLDRLTDRFACEEDARRYLMRMASNLAIDYVRSQANRVRILEGVQPLMEVSSDDLPPSTGNEELDQLRALLVSLTERQRMILQLARLDGLPYKTIAGLMKVSTSLVEKEVANAMRTLAGYAACMKSGSIH